MSKTAMFYSAPQEVRSGYLHKSPPFGPLGTMKQWRRRFFVLFKLGEEAYTLKYFKSEKREKSLGEIDISEISMLLFCPEGHSMWEGIHKNFKCPSSCVLLLRAGSRDYFLIAENSDEADEWFSVLYTPLRQQSLRPMVSHEDIMKYRSKSEPPPSKLGHHVDKDRDRKCKSMPVRPPSLQLYNERQVNSTGLQPNMPLHGPGLKWPPYPGQSSHTSLGYGSEEITPSQSEDSIYDVPRSIRAFPQDGQGCHGYMDMAAIHDAALNASSSETYDSDDSDYGEGNHGEPTVKDLPPVEDKKAEDTRRGSHRHSLMAEMDLRISPEDLRRHLSLTLNIEPPKRNSLLLSGDEILAINDFNIENPKEVEQYLKKVRKNEVVVTIRRLSCTSEPVSGHPTAM